MWQRRISNALVVITLLGFSNVMAEKIERLADHVPLLSPLSQAKGLGLNSEEQSEGLQSGSKAKAMTTVGAFTFRYEGCESDDDGFICHFKVTNNASEDRAIAIARAYIVADGEKLSSKEIFFGNDKDSKIRHRNQINLLPQMTVKLNFKFTDSLPAVEMVGFGINFAAQGDDAPHQASFMSIPLKE